MATLLERVDLPGRGDQWTPVWCSGRPTSVRLVCSDCGEMLDVPEERLRWHQTADRLTFSTVGAIGCFWCSWSAVVREGAY